MQKKSRILLNFTNFSRRDHQSIIRSIVGVSAFFMFCIFWVSVLTKVSSVQKSLENAETSASELPTGGLDSLEIIDTNEKPKNKRENGIEMKINNTNKINIDINIAAVVCGSLEYLKTMVKTSLIFSQDVASLNFIFFADEETKPNLRQYMTHLKSEQRSFTAVNFTYELHDIWFPESSEIDWRQMYIKCTNQRLFFPSLLPHIDSLIYLDTDVILTGNLSEIWTEFSRMNSGQVIAMAPDFDYSYPGTWRTFKKYVNISGANGVNAGVALMNLTRLRAFDFERKIEQVLRENRKEIAFADQDMMNILFHDNPTKIHVLSCIFNFFVPRCTKKAWCADIGEKGIFIVHAAGGYFKSVHPSKPITKTFENNDQIAGSPAFFSWIYNVTRDFQMDESPWKLRDQLASDYAEGAGMSCYGNSPRVLTQNMGQYLNNLR